MPTRDSGEQQHRSRPAEDQVEETAEVAGDLAERKEALDNFIEKDAKRPLIEITPIREAPREPSRRVVREKQKEKQGKLFETPVVGDLPPITLLNEWEDNKPVGYSPEALEAMSKLLEIKLKDFSIDITVVGINPGPVITRFEVQPAAGIKVSRISNLVKDLARSLAVSKNVCGRSLADLP